MRLRQLTGHARTFICHGCGKDFTGGTHPYISASSGKPIQPDNAYIVVGSCETYCEPCAVSVIQDVDASRSVTMFYSDTYGHAMSGTV